MGFLAGPSYVGITKSGPLPKFIGVDDPTHHTRMSNVEPLLVNRVNTWRLRPEAGTVRATLDRHLTDESVAGEVAYFEGDGRTSTERPYGLAWLLCPATELHTWDDEQAFASSILQPESIFIISTFESCPCKSFAFFR